MIDPLQKLELDYATALRQYLIEASEDALQHAYELGRAIVDSQLGILDLVSIHHGALVQLLVTAQASQIIPMAKLAETFFAECLAPLEMTLRGFRETNATLHFLNQTLQQLNQGLEKRVTERTNALAAANTVLEREIAERKRAEQEVRALNTELEHLIAERTAQLRQSETKFATAFRASPAAISIAALPDGRWLEINDALVKMTGYSREELIGHTSVEFGLVDAVGRAKILEAIHVQGSVRDVEIQMHTKSKEIVDVLVSTEQIELNGQPCALTIQYDITDLKRAEREVRRLNFDLEQRQVALETTNKELEAFSYSVSHDLRAPLRAIDGFSRIMLRDYAAHLPDEGQRRLQSISDNAQRMSQLIDDLLAFSRLSQKPIRKILVAPADLVQSALAELSHEQAARHVEITLHELPACQADPALLKQVFVNLLSNALKYTRTREVAHIEIGCIHSENAPIYFVKDNGVGFDLRYADRLFGVFQRLHRAEEFEGTGVGLAIVQRVVHRHGGRVWAAAQLDHGATFYFTLEGEASHAGKS